MSWKVRIDSGRCIGSGMCAGTAPDLFALGDDHAHPVHEDLTDHDERALEAADICPMLAISVQDADGREIAPR
jgi:ferredoxin